MKDHIKRAYKASEHIYDDVLMQKSIFSRLYVKIFWNGTDDEKIAEHILSWVSSDFKGRILDVPAGTAVFTYKRWKSLVNADITLLDYSEDMLVQAEDRLHECKHISFMQGDAGNLNFDKNTFDIVLSMNGFHAFEDKKDAFYEMKRVLKPGGMFIGCFYIRNESGITDWLVNHILTKKGWFTPPFVTFNELRYILEKEYREVDINHDGSIAYFKCVK